MSDLPIRQIPGDYGLPFFGPIGDRLKYYYSQGEVEFFKTRMHKYESTVFRCNMPPGPFMARDPRVICLLDAVSFQTLFDNSKVEKRDVLDGTFMPSTAFTGGYRACAYLDPSEPNHAVLKGYFLSFLAGKHNIFIPLFRQTISGLLSGLEDEVSSKGSSNFNDLSDPASFEFVFRLLCDKSPSEANIGSKGPKMVDKWLFLQLAPLMTLGLKFNAYGGMKRLFPSLIKWVGSAGEGLHRRLADEIRAAVKKGGVTLSALDEMNLTKSVVYEALRIEPPVPYQYAKAKQDFTIHNHESSFLIKKGEMLFGYQPIATKDPKVFANPDDFIADRFVGEGEKLIEYVYWSNGRETDGPTENKQCPGKELVVLLCRLMLVEFFLNYDTFKVDTSKLVFGSAVVTFKSLTKATDTSSISATIQC
ncbi:UNVERIFIED_CONTAM: Allene oxide synthase 3 [Sesamum radiatum]|uniref:Allene oxide synthase 3 n=1 Tax=Sesamum radiatum TaxID=300843 RepID=A0AAW2MUI7_SESRA